MKPGDKRPWPTKHVDFRRRCGARVERRCHFANFDEFVKLSRTVPPGAFKKLKEVKKVKLLLKAMLLLLKVEKKLLLLKDETGKPFAWRL